MQLDVPSEPSALGKAFITLLLTTRLHFRKRKKKRSKMADIVNLLSVTISS